MKEKIPKSKFTAYLPEKINKMFKELYAYRMMAGSKDTKSDIICQSLAQMHEREFNKFKSKD